MTCDESLRSKSNVKMEFFSKGAKTRPKRTTGLNVIKGLQIFVRTKRRKFAPDLSVKIAISEMKVIYEMKCLFGAWCTF